MAERMMEHLKLSVLQRVGSRRSPQPLLCLQTAMCSRNGNKMYQSHGASAVTGTHFDIRTLDVNTDTPGSECDEMSFLLQLFCRHFQFCFVFPISFKWQIHLSLFKRQRLIQCGDTPLLMKSEGAWLFVFLPEESQTLTPNPRP